MRSALPHRRGGRLDVELHHLGAVDVRLVGHLDGHAPDRLSEEGRLEARRVAQLRVHGGAAGLANCIIEINQDQVRDAAGIDRWATILEEIMPEILRIQDLHRVKRF